MGIKWSCSYTLKKTEKQSLRAYLYYYKNMLIMCLWGLLKKSISEIKVYPGSTYNTRAYIQKKNWEYKKCKKLFVRSIPFREATLRTAAAKSLKGHFSRCWKKFEHNAGTQVKEWVRDSCIEWNYASRATFFLARWLRRSSRVLAVRRHPINAQFLMGT